MTTPEFKLPQLTIRQLVQATLLVLSVAAVFYFFYRFHQVFLILFVAIVLSAALRPIVGRLNAFGIPKDIGVVLVYIVLIAIIATVVILLLPMTIEQGNQLVNTVPEFYRDVHQSMLQYPNFFVWRLASELPARIDLASDPDPANDEETAEEEVIESVGQNLQLISLTAKSIFFVVAVLLIAFYWTLDGQKNKTALLLLVPLKHRENARELISEIQSQLGAFIRGQAILGLVIGALSFVAYLLIDLPNAVALAIVAGLMELVPIIGPFLGAIPAVIVAYTVDPTKVLWVLLATIIIQQLENNLLVPRVMKKSVGVNPLVTLLALSAFGSLFGLLGAVVAIPLAAIIQLLLNRYVIESAVPDKSSIPGRDRVSVLQYEVQELTRDIRKSIRDKDIEPDDETDEVEDTIEAIAADLDSVLANHQIKLEEKKD